MAALLLFVALAVLFMCAAMKLAQLAMKIGFAVLMAVAVLFGLLLLSLL